MPREPRIVITGIAGLCAAGNDIAQIGEGLCGHRSFLACGLSAVTTPPGPVGRIAGFDDSAYFDPKEIRRYPLFIRYAAAAALHAWRDAGLEEPARDGDASGCMFGTAHGSTLCYLDENPTIAASVANGHVPRALAFYPTAGLSNLAAGMISLKLGLKGPLGASSAGMLSGSHGVAQAARSIAFGEAQAVVCGAADTPVSPLGLHVYRAAGWTTSHAYMPWSEASTGFALGEGAGALVLEEAAHAAARGAPVYAELAGTGFGAAAVAAPDAAQWAQARLRTLSGALRRAGLAPADVDVLVLDGWALAASDAADRRLLAQLRDAGCRAAVVELKSRIGHTLGASGALESAVLCHIIRSGEVPEGLMTASLAMPGERKKPVRTAALISSAMGGMTSCLLFKKHETD